MNVLTTTMKKKELNREYAAFVGEEKSKYYLKKFEAMNDKGNKLSINFSALFFSTYWCFYRKLFLQGTICLACSFAGLYISLMLQMPTIGQALMFIPSLACGLFGNYFYYNYANSAISKALTLKSQDKEKYYATNGDTSTRIVLGILAAFLFFGLALFFSAGPEAISNMMPVPPPVAPPAQ